jgi:hypothetical protein
MLAQSEDCSNIKNKQRQIRMAALIDSISVLVLGPINAPSMTHAQNTNSTLSNATTAESHTTNTTDTPLNATASSSSSLPCHLTYWVVASKNSPCVLSHKITLTRFCVLFRLGSSHSFYNGLSQEFFFHMLA